MIPILYSFRRCPYAIRARMALGYSQIVVAHREISFKNKPEHMLQCSPQGTVPVLVLSDKSVLDESLDIMYWALSISDPEQWLPQDKETLHNIQLLIEQNDTIFKQHLDHYKYADRFPERTVIDYRNEAVIFIQQLEALLQQQAYLFGERISIADIALFPFVRQFAFVDKDWFYQTRYQQVQHWLDHFLQSSLFTSIMIKHPLWSSVN